MKGLCARAVRSCDVSVGISREKYEHTSRQKEVGNFASHRSVHFWHDFLDESHFLCMKPVSAVFPTHGKHPSPASLPTSSANSFAKVLSDWHAVNGTLWPRQ